MPILIQPLVPGTPPGDWDWRALAVQLKGGWTCATPTATPPSRSTAARARRRSKCLPSHRFRRRDLRPGLLDPVVHAGWRRRHLRGRLLLGDRHHCATGRRRDDRRRLHVARRILVSGTADGVTAPARCPLGRRGGSVVEAECPGICSANQRRGIAKRLGRPAERRLQSNDGSYGFVGALLPPPQVTSA